MNILGLSEYQHLKPGQLGQRRNIGKRAAALDKQLIQRTQIDDRIDLLTRQSFDAQGFDGVLSAQSVENLLIHT